MGRTGTRPIVLFSGVSRRVGCGRCRLSRAALSFFRICSVGAFVRTSHEFDALEWLGCTRLSVKCGPGRDHSRHDASTLERTPVVWANDWNAAAETPLPKRHCRNAAAETPLPKRHCRQPYC